MTSIIISFLLLLFSCGENKRHGSYKKVKIEGGLLNRVEEEWTFQAIISNNSDKSVDFVRYKLKITDLEGNVIDVKIRSYNKDIKPGGQAKHNTRAGVKGARDCAFIIDSLSFK